MVQNPFNGIERILDYGLKAMDSGDAENPFNGIER